MASSGDGTESVAGGPLFQGYLVVLGGVEYGPPAPGRLRTWLSTLRSAVRPRA
ncbi:hypothetical protein [Dactylosporangium matsuzakiense]|uniref:hypothetical protein n=1 Tax=Dactylosporangium matsuzakiense TaxID=53360 RepID=UPI0022F31482|nr:hypothetical protein [Dactylosporangium matsuzakiense]